jgi:hypothetical protein
LQVDIQRSRWSKKKIFVVVILISFGYGIWFNYLDSAKYCSDNGQICEDIGKILGGNSIYQPWNVIGHCIPGLFLLVMTPKRWGLFLAGVLISSSVMDSPLWGVMRLTHDLPLWNADENCIIHDTPSLLDWIIFYYNPIGTCQVWGDSWPIEGQPTSMVIFWSIVARVAVAIILILKQERLKPLKNYFNLNR